MAASAPLEAARAALEAGDWPNARAGFAEALAVERSADALDGLGRALWWSRAPSAAVDLRTEAYAALRREGRAADAARTAVWLAREYRSLYRNDRVALGWVARARTVSGSDDGDGAAGWVLLAESEVAGDAGDALRLAGSALAAARRDGDVDLEIAALARSAVLEVAMGDVAAGLAQIDEAMAAATAGEARDQQYVGEALCTLIEVAALLGDLHPVSQWASVLAGFRDRYDFAPLTAFGRSPTSALLSSYCGSCCGTVYLVTGRLDEAEQELTTALRELEEAGLHSRCVHPVTQLAELRIAQGRLDEARELLARYEDFPECVRPLVTLDLTLGRPDAAASRLREGLGRLRDRPLACLPLWSRMVDADLALGDADGAAAAAAEVASLAELTGSTVHAAEALAARGKVAAARGEQEGAALLREAARRFGDASMPLAACRSRLAYAKALATSDSGLAVAEARATLAALERLGAGHDADEAAAFLRDLGIRGRTGPKRVGNLSRREQEVLALVSQGLSNAEIAQRLFISTKTAGHHVSSILAKLGLRSRTEAAAYAVLHPPGPEPGDPVREAAAPVEPGPG